MSEKELRKVIREEILNEISYQEFKKDDSMSHQKKVNLGINEINKMLYQIERVVNRNIKLKREANISSDNYWKSTRTKLNKVAERLTRLSNRVKNLGE